MKSRIYQIYYSEETRAKLDAGFIPLDNTGQRPDWYEYWPIRRFLLDNTLDEDARYGFFSPKFGEKTGLSSMQVQRFLDEVPDSVDVVTFSPYFANIAFFKNVFEQAEHFHPGIAAAFADVMRLLFPDAGSATPMNDLLMSSARTVYCNYFVAKPSFWRRWLTICEKIFEIAEAGDTPFAEHLNANHHYGKPTAAKVFVIERIVSIVLNAEPSAWSVRNFDPALQLVNTDLFKGKYRGELLTLDALKCAANVTGLPAYYDRYMQARDRLIARSRNSSLARLKSGRSAQGLRGGLATIFRRLA